MLGTVMRSLGQKRWVCGCCDAAAKCACGKTHDSHSRTCTQCGVEKFCVDCKKKKMRKKDIAVFQSPGKCTY